MGDMLSQEEIDALLGGGSSNSNDSADVHDILTPEQKDIIGEIGNISMGTSATTLFALLGKKVTIDTPSVSTRTWQEMSESYSRPCVGIRVDYKEGLRGSNILILSELDVKIIANLMMGGDGNVSDDVELTEIDLSAIGEAMNQMVGSSSTSLSSMISRKIDIDTPQAFLLDFDDDSNLETVGFEKDEIVVCTSFKMEVDSLIDSEIMQIIPKEFALEVVDILSGGFGKSADAEGSGNTDKQVTEQKPQSPEPQNNVPSPQMYQQMPSAQPMPEMYQQAPPMQPMPQMYQQQPTPQMYQQQPMPQMYQQPMPQPDMPMYYSQPAQQNVNVKPAQFQNFDMESIIQQKENIGIIMDVPLEVTVELGRTRKKIKEILEFAPGTIVELDKLAGEPIDILVNGKFVAKGEVVVIDENFGIRITDIISVENRI